MKLRRAWCAGSTTTRARRLKSPADVLGAQNALLGGGRYDGLSEMLGGPPAPGFGFAIGQDRLVLARAKPARNIEAARAARGLRGLDGRRGARAGHASWPANCAGRALAWKSVIESASS